MRYICSTKDHGYRDSTNPLRGLNMQRLVTLQESGERGEYADLMWFYYYMERSDAMIHSVIQRRRAALLARDWDVRMVSQATDDPLAQEQADFLRMVYDGIDNFREAVSFLFTGFFRGFAHLEKHWTSGGLIERLEPVEKWFFPASNLINHLPLKGRTVSYCYALFHFGFSPFQSCSLYQLVVPNAQVRSNISVVTWPQLKHRIEGG
jgi:phage gp29-like protein